MVRKHDYAAIAADKKAGMSWSAIKKKYKCSGSTIAAAIKSKTENGRRKKLRTIGGELAIVNAALKRAAKREDGRYFVTFGSNKIPSMHEYKTKAEALGEVLALRLHNKKHVRLLKEIPFKLTVVAEE